MAKFRRFVSSRWFPNRFYRRHPTGYSKLHHTRARLGKKAYSLKHVVSFMRRFRR